MTNHDLPCRSLRELHNIVEALAKLDRKRTAEIAELRERLARLEKEHEPLVARCEVDGCDGTRLPGFQRCLWHTQQIVKGD